ncbi:MAG: hypothetical protein KAT34_10560 [Candidatus Aminicenantes bacterium]|nr:hypothetical protein [Candidatus Aminicenantes bacterium]
MAKQTVREKILEDIKAALELIKTENGYENDVLSVQRWKQSGNSTLLVPCIIINASGEPRRQDPHPLISCRLSVYLDLWIRHDEDDPESTDTYLNSLLLDIENALMVDYTRNALAQNTEITNLDPFRGVEGNPHAGVSIEVEIRYRHEQGDPTQAR